LTSELCAGGVCVLSIDSPPVNALSHPVRDRLLNAIRKAEQDEAVRAIVLLCSGRTFFAGADVSEFGKPLQLPLLPFLLNEIEALPKITVAAIHGAALGGGLETALACHYRIAVPSAIVGLPEVTLGILPGAGGTQRLPRLTGIEFALDFIVKGKPVNAVLAHQVGILDRLAPEGGLFEAATGYARELLDSEAPLQRARDRTDRIRITDSGPDVFLDYEERNAREFRGYKAPARIIEALRAAVELPFDEGLKREWQLLEELMGTREAAAQQYMFFAERTTRKVPGVPADTPTNSISSTAIVGSGSAATGIAMAIRDADIQVLLIDDSANLTDAAGADLVIEAMPEDSKSRRDILSKLETVAKPSALLAFTTSSVSVDNLGAGASHRDRTIGLHFDAPAHGSRLLEIVRTEATSPSALATALSFAKKIGKVPVVSRDRKGSIGDRAMTALRNQAEAMVAEGVLPADVDRVLQNYGFPPRRFALSSLRPQSPRAEGVTVISKEHMLERLLYPVINEGAKMLEDGTAIRASDIDVAMVVRFGWPTYTGGPMFWADTIGIRNVCAALIGMQRSHGDDFRPALLLEELSRSNRGFQDP
jgi:3-hydroxyacyl-CoA dehydrogenase